MWSFTHTHTHTHTYTHSRFNEKRITCVDILTSQFSLFACTEYTMKMPESSDPGYLNYFKDS